jgi:hypothetical protein
MIKNVNLLKEDSIMITKQCSLTLNQATTGTSHVYATSIQSARTTAARLNRAIAQIEAGIAKSRKLIEE